MLATACFDGSTDDTGNRGCVGTDFFPSGQRYAGQYLLENQHGRGVFLHPSGFKYMGYLYAGDAEFCGRAISPTGAEYQGMFSEGQPHGVGQVVYGGGSARDAGLWCRGRLLRLLETSPAGVAFDRLLTGHYIGWYDRRVISVQEPKSQLESVLAELNGSGAADCSPIQLDQMTNLKLRDRRAAGFPSHRYDFPPRHISPVRLLAWNDSEDMCQLQTYAYLTEKTGRLDPEVVSVSPQELLRPSPAVELSVDQQQQLPADQQPPADQQQQLPAEHQHQLPAGRLQRASLLLLHASAVNRADVVRLLLRTVRLTPNVMDAAGVSALICAAMRGHTATVNTLLDHGADVNQLTDDGLSALSLCLALHHPDYSTRYHLDQLQVFTYTESNQELAAVLEWRGGEAEPCDRPRRPFPSRPVPLSARRQKAVRRPRPRRGTGADSAEPPPDIRQALVPGPGLTLQPPASGSRRTSPHQHPHPHPHPPGDAASAATGHTAPATHVETAERPGTPTAEPQATERAPDALQAVAEGQSSSTTVRSRATSGTDVSSGADAGSGPPAQSDSQAADGATEGNPPPSWPADWPEEDGPSPPAAGPRSARTDDGTDGSWWERLPAGPLRCCPSLERALTAAAAAAQQESNEETAVRLIEAFCSGTDGGIAAIEYSSPCPGSCDTLAMIKLLLRRGASPEASKVPLPAVHHALLADDRPLLSALLSAGGDPNSRLAKQLGGLAPLHVSCSLPGEGSLQLTALLLRRGADPGVLSDPGPALLDSELLQRRRLPQPETLGARTPLHVVCQRKADTYENKVISRRLLSLLHDSGADAGALCNGHTPLTLALLAGDVAMMVDLLSRGTDPLQQLGPPHQDVLGLAVAPVAEGAFQLEERKQMVRTLLAHGSDPLFEYPLDGEGKTGNILDFAKWINTTDDTLLTAPPHQLKGAQRSQKKQREAFLTFLADLVADAARRHRQMAPLVEGGLHEDAELTTGEFARVSGGPAAAAATAEPPDKAQKKKRRKLLVLSAECFCPICDRVLGKCFKGCPNYGRRTPKLMSTELQMDHFAEDLLDSDSSQDANKPRKKGKRRKRRAEAEDGEAEAHVELGAVLLGPDGKPLKCHACHKNIKRRKILCSACKQILYCSKKCRTTDWDNSHGFTCPARSQMTLSRLPDSGATSPTRTRGSSADSSRRRLTDSERPGRPGRRPGDRGGSLDARGGGGRGRRRRGEGRGGRSLDAQRGGKPRMAPIAGRLPPWLAAFMSQFEGVHVGECRHLVLGEWYEDNCKMKENYSYI